MPPRLQRTIARPVELGGIGFLTGADVTLRFLPAAENEGIAFQRRDCANSLPIPARIEYLVPRQRRTAIENGGVAVEMIEHVMAALAGLQIDNCLVQLDAPEPPGCDGSSRQFAETLLEAGVVEQTALRRRLVIENNISVCSPSGPGEICGTPLKRPTFAVSYQLDYGPHSPIPAQNLTVEISPESFVRELAFARTFLLEEEAEALRGQGYGKRTTARDLLVFGRDGVIDNQLHTADECARHKILDCLGDFALLGCDLHGHISAYRSGHCLNHDMSRCLEQSQGSILGATELQAA